MVRSTPKSTNDGRFGYTGQTWLPQLGLNYYKARVYSPKLGRFLQTDPILYIDDMNMYAYVYNDPANRIDPTGMQDESPDAEDPCPDNSCNKLPPGGSDHSGGEPLVEQPTDSPYEADGVTLKKPKEESASESREPELTAEQKRLAEANVQATMQRGWENAAAEAARNGEPELHNQAQQQANESERNYMEKMYGKKPTAKDMPATKMPVPDKNK